MGRHVLLLEDVQLPELLLELLLLALLVLVLVLVLFGLWRGFETDGDGWRLEVSV